MFNRFPWRHILFLYPIFCKYDNAPALQSSAFVPSRVASNSSFQERGTVATVNIAKVVAAPSTKYAGSDERKCFVSNYF